MTKKKLKKRLKGLKESHEELLDTVVSLEMELEDSYAANAALCEHAKELYCGIGRIFKENGVAIPPVINDPEFPGKTIRSLEVIAGNFREALEAERGHRDNMAKLADELEARIDRLETSIRDQALEVEEEASAVEPLGEAQPKPSLLNSWMS
jgi:predicted  nucleic acid-binding Zn-ribbon protein